VTQLFDSVPEFVLSLLIGIAMLAAYEIGFRIGAWREKRSPNESDGPTGMLVGSILALMAFLLAITVGMAVERFDTRRTLVQAEANAIGTTYLRAGYLNQPQSDQIRELLRQYVPLRITTADPVQLQDNINKSSAITDQIWAITQDIVTAYPDSVSVSLFVETVNDTIDLQGSRVTAINARVPEPILLFLMFGSLLAIGLAGYGAGLTMRRSLIAAVTLIVLFSAVLSLVLDINQPASGLFEVSQQPLLTLEQQVGPPS